MAVYFSMVLDVRLRFDALRCIERCGFSSRHRN